MKRTVSRRGKGSKTAHKKGSKKGSSPAKKRPIRRPPTRKPAHRKPSPTRKPAHRKPSSTARYQALREARELQRLIREQEAAERQARRDEAREARALDRLIEEQEEAARQSAREEKAARRREREAQLRAKGRSPKQIQKLIKLEEFFEREAEKEARRAQRQRERETEKLKADRLREWRELADASRAERGQTKKERARARKQDKKAAKEIIEYKSIEQYITDSLWEVYNCLGNLGFKVDEPQCWKYQDGSFDAQVRILDPDDTTGQAALLELQKCIKPVAGAFIALGFRHYPSLRTERRVEKKDIDGRFIHGSLRHMEMGQYTNLTNYRVAGTSEIAAHVDVTHKWLGDFSEKNQAWCSQILVRYYYGPDNKPPHEGEHDRINEGENPGGKC